jgi:hypothetical protein
MNATKRAKYSRPALFLSKEAMSRVYGENEEEENVDGHRSDNSGEEQYICNDSDDSGDEHCEQELFDDDHYGTYLSDSVYEAIYEEPR